MTSRGDNKRQNGLRHLQLTAMDWYATYRPAKSAGRDWKVCLTRRSSMAAAIRLSDSSGRNTDCSVSQLAGPLFPDRNPIVEISAMTTSTQHVYCSNLGRSANRSADAIDVHGCRWVRIRQ